MSCRVPISRSSSTNAEVPGQARSRSIERAIPARSGAAPTTAGRPPARCRDARAFLSAYAKAICLLLVAFEFYRTLAPHERDDSDNFIAAWTNAASNRRPRLFPHHGWQAGRLEHFAALISLSDAWMAGTPFSARWFDDGPGSSVRRQLACDREVLAGSCLITLRSQQKCEVIVGLRIRGPQLKSTHIMRLRLL